MKTIVSAFIFVVCLTYFTEAQGSGCCRFNSVWHEDGEVFLNDCNLCGCDNRIVRCTLYECTITCNEDGLTYYGNEPMPPFDVSDQYWECGSNGEKICYSEACAVPDCPEVNRYTPTGECCSQCGCVYDGQWYNIDAQINIDACTFCSCFPGERNAACAVIDCAPLTCDNFSTIEGECCAKCNCVWHNKEYQHGEPMQRGKGCTECPVCDDGERKCEACP